MSTINNNHKDIQSKLFKKVCNLKVEKLVRQASDNFVYMADYETALEQVNEALSIESDHVKALILKGNILYCLDKNSKAIDYLDMALNIDPSCSEAYGAKAGMLDMLGNTQDALFNCEQAFLNMSGKDRHLLPSLYDQKIAILISMKKFEQAKESLQCCMKNLSEEDSNYLLSCYQSQIESYCKEQRRKRDLVTRRHLKVV